MTDAPPDDLAVQIRAWTDAIAVTDESVSVDAVFKRAAGAPGARLDAPQRRLPRRRTAPLVAAAAVIVAGIGLWAGAGNQNQRVDTGPSTPATSNQAPLDKAIAYLKARQSSVVENCSRPQDRDLNPIPTGPPAGSRPVVGVGPNCESGYLDTTAPANGEPSPVHPTPTSSEVIGYWAPQVFWLTTEVVEAPDFDLADYEEAAGLLDESISSSKPPVTVTFKGETCRVVDRPASGSNGVPVDDGNDRLASSVTWPGDFTLSPPPVETQPTFQIAELPVSEWGPSSITKLAVLRDPQHRAHMGDGRLVWATFYPQTINPGPGGLPDLEGQGDPTPEGSEKPCAMAMQATDAETGTQYSTTVLG